MSSSEIVELTTSGSLRTPILLACCECCSQFGLSADEESYRDLDRAFEDRATHL